MSVQYFFLYMFKRNYLILLLIFTIYGSHQFQLIHFPKFNFCNCHKTGHKNVKKDVSTLRPCDEDTLMEYLVDLQAISPESIVNLSTLEEVKELCRRVSESLHSITDYVNNCTMLDQNDLYGRLIQGVRALEMKVCCDGKYKNEFNKYFKCYHDLHTEFEVCEGPPDWIEDKDEADICKAYKEIADCYFVKTAKLCGKHAAKILKELIDAVIQTSVPAKCPEVKRPPKVPDAMPEYLVSKQVQKDLSFDLWVCLPILFVIIRLF